MAHETFCPVSPSKNRKIAEPTSNLMFATYRPTTVKENLAKGIPANNGTCPRDCTLLGSCYANSGMTRLQAERARTRHDNVSEYITSRPQNASLRHLVSGDLFDAFDNVDYGYIDELREGHAARPDVTGLGYTHGWERIDPKYLKWVNGERINCTINASCDTPNDIVNATAAGWDAVTVVPEGGQRVIFHDKYTTVVCPAQTSDTNCERCKLCAKSDRKDKRGLPLVVAFEAHGPQKGKVKQAIAAALGGDA